MLVGGTANDGEFAWTIPESVPLDQYYQLRVRLGGHETLSRPFQIVNAGTDYYVNDGSTVGDVFTTAMGDNAASGTGFRMLVIGPPGADGAARRWFDLSKRERPSKPARPATAGRAIPGRFI